MKKGISLVMLIITMVIIAGLCVTSYFLIVNKFMVDKESENAPLYTMENFPKIDASLATQPLTDAIIANFTGLAKDKIVTDYSNTHPAYVKLINDEVDLIVVTEPSKEELELAKEKGVELISLLWLWFLFLFWFLLWRLSGSLCSHLLS